MSIEHFDDECPGCRPAIMDLKTGKVAAPDSEIQKTADKVWDECPRAVRAACHRVWCNNSREPSDLIFMDVFVQRFKTAMEAVK